MFLPIKSKNRKILNSFEIYVEAPVRRCSSK